MNRKHEHGGKTSESHLNKNVILNALPVKRGQTVLDAGCGNGYMAREFANRVGDSGTVYAIDIHEPSIEKLKRETEGTNIVVMLDSIAHKTALSEASVDLVFLCTVFHGFTPPQTEGFLREVKRILKTGGVLAIVEINKTQTPFGPPMELRYSPDDLKKIVDFREDSLTDIGEYYYMQTFIK
jgi:ubiquinone/menaquinone biosynthesis C-methylase UbiE